jgi:hypothetical protein
MCRSPLKHAAENRSAQDSEEQAGERTMWEDEGDSAQLSHRAGNSASSHTGQLIVHTAWEGPWESLGSGKELVLVQSYCESTQYMIKANLESIKLL